MCIETLLRFPVPGSRFPFFRLSILDHQPVRQADHPTGASGKRQVVRHEHDARSRFAVELLDQLDDATARAGVQIASGFVGEQDSRVVGEGSRDRHALLLTAGQLGREMVHAIPQSHAREQLDRARGGAAFAAELEWHLHVLQRRERWNELNALEDEPNFLATKASALILGQAPEIDTVEDHRAAGGGIESGQQSEQRGLAAPGRPDDRDEGALWYRERHIAEHGELVRSALDFFRQLSSNEHA